MNYFLKTNHTNLTDDSSPFFYTFYTLLPSLSQAPDGNDIDSVLRATIGIVSGGGQNHLK